MPSAQAFGSNFPSRSVAAIRAVIWKKKSPGFTPGLKTRAS
jgi:hypothetical protein